MSSAANPCLSCTINQGCCTSLTGLCLTKAEYERCFEQHADQLIVKRRGPLYIVSQTGGAACPNWQNGGCAVYDQRPRECALFPHTLYLKKQDGSDFTICIHSDTKCPQKKQLLSSKDDAEKLVLEFATEAFGESASITVRCETLVERISRFCRNLVNGFLASLRKK